MQRLISFCLIIMRQVICILLILLSAFCAAKNIPPFNIVDGKVGVAPAELPLPEEIAQTTVLGSKEAVSIYGERASGGAFIITTKKFASEQQVQQKTIPATKQKKRNISSVIGGGAGILLAIILFLLSKPLRKCASKIQKRINKHRGVNRPIYDTRVFDPEGVRFNASERIWNYVPILVSIICIALFGWLLVEMVHEGGDKGIFEIFLFVLIMGMIGYFVYCTVSFYKKLQGYLIIDEKGIRGVCMEPLTGVKPVFYNIDLRWEQVGRASMMDSNSIEFFKKGLKLPEHFEDIAELAEVEGIEDGVVFLELAGFPSNKVKDAVNFYYARYKDQHPDEFSVTKKKSYLLSPQKNAENLYQWIVVIIFIIGSLLAAVLSVLC